jgi:hypothetical protein
MRLDARAGDTGWDVWHVPTCRQVRYCVWVDDDAAQYGAWESVEQMQRAIFVPSMLFGIFGSLSDQPEPPTHQAKRITIHADRRLVLIDPIEDEEPESVADVLEAARTAPADPVVSAALSLPGAAFALGLRARGFFSS